MSEYSPEASPVRTRVVGTMCAETDDTVITVEHVWAPDGEAGSCCEDGCEGATHDPGMVGLMMTGDGGTVCGLLTAAEALEVANRLIRAANLVYESEEQIPDVEREAARFSAGRAS